MAIKKLLIVYAKNPGEILNRKSAIGSYIYCLAILLQSDSCDVYINGKNLQFLEQSEKSTATSLSNSRQKKYKKLIPAFIKQYIKDKILLKAINNLKAEILNSSIVYDHVLEFYTFGSDIGKQISTSQNCDLTVVYDGPILEEYEFFNNRQTIFKKEIIYREHQSLLKAKSIVVYSNAVKNYVLTQHPSITAEFYIHQNIDFSRFTFSDKIKPTDELNICFVGSFLKWHRVDLLLEVFGKITNEYSNKKIQLFLIGDGEEKSKSEELAKQLKLSNVIFTGFLDGTQLTAMQEKMQIGIMPSSNWYGAPNKIFEYGAMNMACLAPRTPTIEHIFSENEILFFENNDKKTMYTALSKIVSDENLRLDLSKKLNSFIKNNYSEKRTKELYQKLVG